ncbi:hypothetical protein CA850_25120 [Micromonospora echinospora]|nr:hypothetical protein CA850_25120 [Micromonospora echinospora]
MFTVAADAFGEVVQGAAGQRNRGGVRQHGEAPGRGFESWSTAVLLELRALTAVLTTAAVRERLVRGGSVITIGSIAADTGAGAYGAAKAAVAAWNVDLAAQLGAHGVTANVVAPGYIADTEFFRDQLTDERRDELIAATHTGRAGTPDDVATTVHFLASRGARHIQTGCACRIRVPRRRRPRSCPQRRRRLGR